MIKIVVSYFGWNYTKKLEWKTFPFKYNVAEYLSELSLYIQVIKSRGTGFKTLLQVQNYTFANLRA